MYHLLMEVRPRRVGGATYQVPMEVSVGSPNYFGNPLDSGGSSRSLWQIISRKTGLRIN